MTEHAGRGDPARTMALLWGASPAGTRGPKQRLDVERIVAEAVKLADEAGLAALSMRRVADALGVGAMSLYTYVPGKAELLEVMVDRVIGEQPLPDPAGGWRAGLEGYAREGWALYRAHPWLLQVGTARTVLGPRVVALFDAALRVVADVGLEARQMVGVIGLVDDYVRGAARGLQDAVQATPGTGQSDDAWWESRREILDTLYDPARFPTLTAVGAAGAFEQTEGGEPYTVQRALDAFGFGLERVLDGIEVLVASRSG
jgi:AcrR family transcriptional regulator